MTDRPSLVDGLEVTEVPDGLVLFDGRRGRVHFLNASASIVLLLCDGERERRDIVNEARSLASSSDGLEASVHACLEQLEQEGIIRSGA